MLNTENAVIEILPGKVDDSTAREVYRNLQVLYGTVAGEQALDREFGIDGSIIDYPTGECASSPGCRICAQNRTV